MGDVDVRVKTGSRVVDARAREGQTLLDVLRANSIPLAAACGGAGTCGKCRVTVAVDGGAPQQLLACRTTVRDGLLVTLEAPAPLTILEQGTAPRFHADQDASGLGVAIDVGTTTVVCRLYNRATGAYLGTAAQVNPQAAYGADVISRITASMSGNLNSLHGLLVETLASMIAGLCHDLGQDVEKVGLVALAGNTVMEHLAAGLSPSSIGVAPFDPLSFFGDFRVVPGLPATTPPAAAAAPTPVPVYFAPAVGGYVGGDITCGLLAVGMYSATAPCLLIDLGTNGEMVLGDRTGMLSCATAAGPVFEGAGIHLGMPALPGAVSGVEDVGGADGSAATSGTADASAKPPAPSDGLPILHVIGGDEPVGICGSGLVDAMAFLLRHGIVDASGLLLDSDEVPAPYAAHLGTEAGVNAFYLNASHTIYLTQKDVRNLQLAKSAICSGIYTLLEESGTALASVARLSVAGGFGQFLNLASAAAIGLFPRELLNRAQSVGNTAIEGASAALLSSSARSELAEITRNCRYLELSTSPAFNGYFMDLMMFPA